MDDGATARPARTAGISNEETDRRREIVRQADANNRIEGVCRSPETNVAFDAYIQGEIEVTDIVPLLKAQRGPRDEAGASSAPALKTRITPKERAQRQAADDYARGSLRLEGFVPSEYSDQMTRRYIDGEITRAELMAAILAHHRR